MYHAASPHASWHGAAGVNRYLLGTLFFVAEL